MSSKASKLELLKQYGKYCMLCRRKLKLEECTFHHIIPKQNGGESSFENGSILCRQCHSVIHLFKYEDDAYKKITKRIFKFKGTQK